MKFMMMHKHDPNTEAGIPPPMTLVEEMGHFIDGFARAGQLVDGAGLSASKNRSRLTFKNGACTVQHGPYTGQHELPSAMLLLRVRTRDDAIGWAQRYGEILGDGEIELGKVVEPWDLGLVPEPPNPPLQMLLVDKADAQTEAGGRSAETRAAISKLKTEMTDAGVLLRSLNLQPSSKGKRLTFKKNHLQIIDGPFAESKELVGGFAVLDLIGMDEILEVCKRYAEILGGTLEVDVRVVE